MDVREQIIKAAEAKLTTASHFVVDVIVSKHKLMKVTVILDGDNGVTIDDCSKLSRAISAEIEEGGWIGDENYTLEVGTPGLDHPLKLKRQYTKNIGRTVIIHQVNKNKLQGELIAVDENKVILAIEVKEGKKTQLKNIEILFSEIEKTLVTVSFKK